MLFVLSVERIWNMAWYMLNQVTLERGPDESLLYPHEDCSQRNDNCWSEGNAGKIPKRYNFGDLEFRVQINENSHVLA